MKVQHPTLVNSTRNNNVCFKSKVHIVDGFLHADNMEHFAKATLKKLNSYEIKSLSVFDSKYISVQKKIGDYYKDMAEYCEQDGQYYPARVCRWAMDELKNQHLMEIKLFKDVQNKISI